MGPELEMPKGKTAIITLFIHFKPQVLEEVSHWDITKMNLLIR